MQHMWILLWFLPSFGGQEHVLVQISIPWALTVSTAVGRSVRGPSSTLPETYTLGQGLVIRKSNCAPHLYPVLRFLSSHLKKTLYVSSNTFYLAKLYTCLGY